MARPSPAKANPAARPPKPPSPSTEPPANSPEDAQDAPDEESGVDDRTPPESPGESRAPEYLVDTKAGVWTPARKQPGMFDELAILEAGVAWNGVLLLMMWFFLFLTYFI